MATNPPRSASTARVAPFLSPRFLKEPAPKEPARGEARFARAASVLELAQDFDHAIAPTLLEPHIAMDGYGRILGVAPLVARTLGFPVARLVGRRLRHRVVAADRTQFQAMLSRARASRPTEPIVVCLRAHDERRVDVRLTPSVVTNAAGFVIVVFRVAVLAGAGDDRTGPAGFGDCA